MARAGFAGAKPLTVFFCEYSFASFESAFTFKSEVAGGLYCAHTVGAVYSMHSTHNTSRHGYRPALNPPNIVFLSSQADASRCRA